MGNRSDRLEPKTLFWQVKSGRIQGVELERPLGDPLEHLRKSRVGPGRNKA